MSKERPSTSGSEGRFGEVESKSFDKKAADPRERAALSETPNGCGGPEDEKTCLPDPQDVRVENKNPAVVEGQSAKPQVEEIVSASDSSSIGIEEYLVSGDSGVGEHTGKSKDGTLKDCIQMSQWSLFHKIKVCRACMEHNSSESRIMTPLSSIEYAQQSLALVDKVYNPPLASLEWISDCSWESEIKKLHETLESSDYKAWEALRKDLTAKLSSVRDSDKKHGWHNVFDKNFEPWQIYKAVEEEKLQSFKDMMLKIGVEHWGLISPAEYKRATPLHWAVLHGQEEMVSFMKEEILYWELASVKASQKFMNPVDSCDEFGFTPLHMASFSCLMARGFSDEDAKRCSRIAATLFDMGGRSCGSCGSHSNFLVFAEAPGSSGAYFVARHYLSSFNHPIHPIQLAVWFAHPCLVETLMSRLMKEAFVKTDDKNTILHLAAWGINKQHGKVMTLLLRYLHLSPAALNYCNQFEMQTPLHMAVFQGKYECVAALVRCHYTRFSTKNSIGLKPREIAQLLMDSCTPTNLARIVFDWSLGRKDYNSTKLRFSTLYLECNEAHDMQSEAKSLKAVMTKIFNLIHDHELLGLEERILRHREILQMSLWSKRHRILAFWMFCEGVDLELKTGVYANQYQKLSETLCQGMDGFSKVNSNKQIRASSVTSESKKLTDEFLNCSDVVDKKLQSIYCVVEEGDLDEFKRRLSELPKEYWWEGLKQYGGATLLHWAAFHGKEEMVSFIRKEIVPSTNLVMNNERQIWSKIKDARDIYGFTPLHLAVLSLYSQLSPWLNHQKEYYIEKEEDAAKKCAEVIEEVYKIFVPNRSNTSKDRTLNFSGWNVWDYRHADDHDLSDIEVYPIHLGVWFAHPRVVEKLVNKWPGDELFVKTSKGDTIFHCATWNVSTAPKQLISLLSTSPSLGNSSNELNRETPLQNFVNMGNKKRETPLHYAVYSKNPAWVEILLLFDRINVNLPNKDWFTPRELAVAMSEDSTQAGQHGGNFQKLVSCWSDGTSETEAEDGPLEKIIYLIDCKDPTGCYRETEALQKERQVYVDAANAILVGAALIASASFGAWLQPPLGYKEYFSSDFLLRDGPANTYEAFVAIKQYWIIHLFWIFNSLSFFFSLATVIAGANAALPQQGLNVKDAVNSVRGAVRLASRLLALAIVFVVGTFTSLGFAIVPHIEKYRINMYCTVFVGLLVCVSCLAQLLQKLSPNAGSTKSGSSRSRWSKQQKGHSKPSRNLRSLSMVIHELFHSRTPEQSEIGFSSDHIIG